MGKKHDYAKEPYEKLVRDDPELKATVQLTVTYHANGALSVSGPIDDVPLCMWLIEQAKDAVNRRHHQGLIIPDTDVGKPVSEKALVLP